MKKGELIIRVVISTILGFLPSFAFITMFMQYGSPFVNYYKFLSTWDNSWWAWITAIILVMLFYASWGIIKSKKNLKKILKHKYALLIIFLFILAFSSIMFFQLYLYTKFILGSDLLVRLSADKENIFFTNNENENITFKISVITNPFCMAQCHYQFLDISNGRVIDEGNFNMTSIFPKSKDYIFEKDNAFKGQVLNKFELSCKSQQTKLCYTRGEESKRTILVTLNYDLSEEQKISKERSKEEIILIGKDIFSLKNNLRETSLNVININDSLVTEDFTFQLSDLTNVFYELNNSFEYATQLWESDKFLSLEEEVPDLKNKVQNINLDVERLKISILSDTVSYNNLIENLTISKQTLNIIAQSNLTNSSCEKLNNIINDFNQAIPGFKKRTNLSDKETIVENIYLEIDSFYKNSKDNIGSKCNIDKKINEINFSKINLIIINETTPSIMLKEKEAICCFYGKCEKCCDNCSDKNYPIIFLHGHSMNKVLPADYSLDVFIGIKKKLANERYIDAGAVVISTLDEEKGLWGKVNAPVEVTASYFFDVYKEGDKETVVQSKTDSIDTYAIRLKDIIDLVKYRTNKDKVIIIAHSMGGLVTRRYVQVFGGKDIDKAILIDTPNHGTDDKIRDYCSLLGPEVVCSEMNKNSIFINRLNNAPSEIIPIYNIIGIGCSMGDETGDGIVKNSSQYLSYATNYYLKGTCDELSFIFLHEQVVYTDKYPELFNIINRTIRI